MRESPNPRLLDAATWRKASYSSATNGCVEVARPDGMIVGFRDSKAPHAGRLAITPLVFGALLDLAKH